jgi:hypothetical protein
MINHKQSVAEHALAVAERERKDKANYARWMGRAILKDFSRMVETDGLDAANAFFTPTLVQTRAKVLGVQKEFLYLTEEIVEQGRNHD